LGDSILGEAIDEVTDDEVFIGEIIEGKTGTLGKQGSRPRSCPLHQIGHVTLVDVGDNMEGNQQ
jgi:hypothetical protein